jgi:hypothetical protein
MRPLVYIVSIVEFAIVAILVVVERIVTKLQIGRRERRRVELATIRAERELHRIASDAFISMVEEARISRSDSKPTSTDQLVDEQI